jgi:hypothetical protein
MVGQILEQLCRSFKFDSSMTRAPPCRWKCVQQRWHSCAHFPRGLPALSISSKLEGHVEAVRSVIFQFFTRYQLTGASRIIRYYGRRWRCIVNAHEFEKDGTAVRNLIDASRRCRCLGGSKDTPQLRRQVSDHLNLYFKRAHQCMQDVMIVKTTLAPPWRFACIRKRWRSCAHSP